MDCGRPAGRNREVRFTPSTQFHFGAIFIERSKHSTLLVCRRLSMLQRQVRRAGWGRSRNPPLQRTTGHDLVFCMGMHDLSCQEMAGYAFGFNPPYGLPVVPICRNPSALPLSPNQRQIPPRPASQRGGSRSSRTRGGMRWTQGALLTRACAGGRRSRVVLMPRRWHQVGGGNSVNDGGKQARSPGRARRKPLKPLRGECRTFPA
jgi:hypothetical protein